MDVNRSGYYKWKYRKLHPSARHTQRIKDVEFIKEIAPLYHSNSLNVLKKYLDKETDC